MAPLPPELRAVLQRAVSEARVASEEAARAALTALTVDNDRISLPLADDVKRLRRGLRARARQLGGFDELVGEVAYEQWHLMLFARFLAENQLLMHPDAGVSVSLDECGQLAPDLGEPNEWMVAARFASAMLPGIFRPDDPSLQVPYAQEGRARLERILSALPSAVFVADDSLGWVYQFWQTKAKKTVNASETKIGGAELAPVTQLFTDNYMVRFLLQNSLGAWWASRHPDSPLVPGFEYLRNDDEGQPATGGFPDWPDRVAAVTVLDPCCGSGHFLVEAFSMLWQMRAEEEGSDPVAAQDGVLRENLFGLELDARCVQIAMFSLILAASKTTGAWRQIPLPNVACAGIPVKAAAQEWSALADRDERIANALVRLHILFRDADTLGSLIDPKRVTEITDPTGLQRSIEDVDWETVFPILEAAVARETTDPAAAVLGADAAAIARAADFLTRSYTLVVTNVPFLARGRQSETLASYLDRWHATAKGDLATSMFERMWRLLEPSGSLAIVSPIQWLFLSSYGGFRSAVLSERDLALLVRLGARAFTGISGEVASVSLTIASASRPHGSGEFLHADLTAELGPHEKAQGLASTSFDVLHQATQAQNPNAVISPAYEHAVDLLSDFAEGYAGIQTGDLPRFVRFFWELPEIDGRRWKFYQGTVEETMDWGGLEKVLLWENGRGALHQFVAERLGGNVGAWIRGVHCTGRAGVSVSQMGKLPVALYAGQLFDLNNAVILPKDPQDLPAIWHYCRSPQFNENVRATDQSLKVTNQTLVKVPFDIDHWRDVADAAGPLPEPTTVDPTQWLFEGHPRGSAEPLQVAVARLVGYRWPVQKPDELDEFADPDGLVALPATTGELGAADRLRQLLDRAYGDEFSPTQLDRLLAGAGAAGRGLSDWLQERFFEQHMRVFQRRPFVWQVWDGRRDGFSALINYHRLDRSLLEKLTYSVLGSWIETQQAQVTAGATGADLRLAAAKDLQDRLKQIVDGEEPCDIYVRWKGPGEQPIGWEPDVEDGVRLNIRPFVEADILRLSSKKIRALIKWTKDRGANPDGTERTNDIHLSLAQKREERTR